MTRTSKTHGRARAALQPIQKQVLEAVRSWPDSTSQELASRSGEGDPRRLNRRLSELVALGFVKKGATRKCSVTGRQAAPYSPTAKGGVTPPRPRYEAGREPLKKSRCSSCGSGLPRPVAQRSPTCADCDRGQTFLFAQVEGEGQRPFYARP